MWIISSTHTAVKAMASEFLGRNPKLLRGKKNHSNIWSMRNEINSSHNHARDSRTQLSHSGRVYCKTGDVFAISFHELINIPPLERAYRFPSLPNQPSKFSKLTPPPTPFMLAALLFVCRSVSHRMCKGADDLPLWVLALAILQVQRNVGPAGPAGISRLG